MRTYLNYLHVLLFYSIAEIPSTISCLSSLKKLDASGNQLAAVPGDLADCLKMKELLLKENPFKDNRFKKMVAQKGTKAVVDYIRQHFPKVAKYLYLPCSLSLVFPCTC